MTFDEIVSGLLARLTTPVLDAYRGPDQPMWRMFDALSNDTVMHSLSSGEVTILRVACDIYNGYGHAEFNSLCRLDDDNYASIVRALIACRPHIPWAVTA